MTFVDASLAEETRKRYLSYALSVITSRALPDVRDGLKPVQRRILYTMQRDLHLRHDGRYVKCARVIGEVMGKYHPHGDQAIYDALVRMAQDFSLRAPLVDGRGNFGSLDGDPPAAMRYTECKLAKLSTELLAELSQGTVPFRENYDGQTSEPIVLPARFPNLLVNGCYGIAVGMATAIPPHNFGEVADACVALIDDDSLTTAQLLSHIRGPDFPTGGQLVSNKRELTAIYEAGHGSVKLRGEWRQETPKKKRENPRIIIKSIPYAVVRSTLVEKIADVIIAKKLPVLLDIRDESTEETRIVLEYKKGADPELIMAYLYKHTPLQTNFNVNLTCLMPTDQEGVAAPARVSLRELLRAFLDFRMQVVTRRLEYELKKLLERIHVLEGLIIVFDALDETIRIIRRSEGKADAAKKLVRRFELSELQVDAILELKLYRLAKLEILVLREELADKREKAGRIERLLADRPARWRLIRAELLELKVDYDDRRRTKISGATREPEYNAEAFIVDEDQIVLLTQHGWIKRQGRVTDLKSTRVREGDAVLDVTAGSTRASVALFSNHGSCYVCRIVDVQATTGYGSPVHSMFKLADGERIIRMIGFDPRLLEVPEPTESGEPEPPWAIAVTRGGMTTRFSLRAHRDPSTRNGRRYMRLNKGDEVIMVDFSSGWEKVAAVTWKGHALLTAGEEVPILSSAGKGVKLIRLGEGDHVVVARALVDMSTTLVVEKEKGGSTFEITIRKTVTARGGKGAQLFKRGRIARALPVELELPVLEEG